MVYDRSTKPFPLESVNASEKRPAAGTGWRDFYQLTKIQEGDRMAGKVTQLVLQVLDLLCELVNGNNLCCRNYYLILQTFLGVNWFPVDNNPELGTLGHILVTAFQESISWHILWVMSDQRLLSRSWSDRLLKYVKADKMTINWF